MVATTERISMVVKSTLMPKVFTVASDNTVMVTDAPAILIAAPRGIAILAVDSLTPRRFARSRLTGMLAAELRVKKAVMPLSRKQGKKIGRASRRGREEMTRGCI